nr:hypothetical protein GCM10025699_10250 [Microbacterium flavescens]
MPRVRLRPVLAALAAAGLILGTAVAAEVAEPTGTVRGVLQDEAGGLLVRDETKIRVSLFAGDELATPTITTELQSMEMGAFEITGVPVGRYAVKFEPLQGWDTGRAGEWWGDTRRAAERAFIEVSDGGVVELEARLSSLVSIHGTVTGRQLAYPVYGSSIKVGITSGDPELDAWLPRLTTDVRLSDTYAFAVIPGTYDLAVTDTTGAHAPTTAADVVVGAPSTTKDVELQATRASISGKWSLRTTAGVVPMREGSAVLYKWSASQSSWVKQPATCLGGASGAFLFDCLGAGRYKLAFRHSGVSTGFWGGKDLESATEIVLAKNQTVAGIDVVVDAHAHVSGVIGVYAGGEFYPDSGGRLTVWRKNDSGRYDLVADPQGETVTHGDGEFEAHLRPGTYRFKLTPGMSPYVGSTYFKGAGSSRMPPTSSSPPAKIGTSARSCSRSPRSTSTGSPAPTDSRPRSRSRAGSSATASVHRSCISRTPTTSPMHSRRVLPRCGQAVCSCRLRSARSPMLSRRS